MFSFSLFLTTLTLLLSSCGKNESHQESAIAPSIQSHELSLKISPKEINVSPGQKEVLVTVIPDKGIYPTYSHSQERYQIGIRAPYREIDLVLFCHVKVQTFQKMLTRPSKLELENIPVGFLKGGSEVEATILEEKPLLLLIKIPSSLDSQTLTIFNKTLKEVRRKKYNTADDCDHKLASIGSDASLLHFRPDHQLTEYWQHQTFKIKVTTQP